jgi:hypothetical protein
MKKFNTVGNGWQRLRMLLLLALMVLAVGCSSIRLSYNHGDTLLYWWLNSYLDLDSSQAGVVRKELDGLFQWHRKSELRDYAALLATGQRQLAGNLSQADLMSDYRDLKLRGERLALKVLPELTDLARSVRPEQIARMEKKFNKNNEDYRKKFLRGDSEQRQKARYKKSMEQFELWFGSFSGEQEALLRRASDARAADADVWLDERIRRQKNILAVLRKVQQEKLDKAATTVLVRELLMDALGRLDGPERKPFFDAYLDSTTGFIVAAVKLTTPAQKAHAQQRMQGWIEDFNSLATAHP